MIAIEMPRKRAQFKLDDRILDALDRAARKSGRSKNGWLENHLFSLFQNTGYIPSDAEPLGETRGGDRTKKEDADDNN